MNTQTLMKAAQFLENPYHGRGPLMTMILKAYHFTLGMLGVKGFGDFDMGTWENCAVGRLCSRKVINGLRFKKNDGATPEFYGVHGWEAVHTVFGIDSAVADALFTPGCYTSSDKKPEAVAKRIRGLLEFKSSVGQIMFMQFQLDKVGQSFRDSVFERFNVPKEMMGMKVTQEFLDALKGYEQDCMTRSVLTQIISAQNPVVIEQVSL